MNVLRTPFSLIQSISANKSRTEKVEVIVQHVRTILCWVIKVPYWEYGLHSINSLVAHHAFASMTQESRVVILVKLEGDFSATTLMGIAPTTKPYPRSWIYHDFAVNL
jgi:hypothetical protein